MAFKKRYKKRYGRRKSYKMRSGRNMFKSVGRVLARMAEKKHFDESFGNITLGGNTRYFHAVGVGMAQGTAANNRVGNKIYIRYIKIWAQYQGNAGAVANIRWAIVRARDTTESTSGNTPADVLSAWDTDKFHVYHEGYINMPAATTGLNSKCYSWTIKIMKTVKFDSSSPGDTINAPLNLYAVSPNGFYYNIQTRTTFIDL